MARFDADKYVAVADIGLDSRSNETKAQLDETDSTSTAYSGDNSKGIHDVRNT